jgi:arginase family enzyme
LNRTIEREGPLALEENVVHVGSRAIDPAESKALASSPIELYSASTVQKEGVASIAERSASYLANRCD